jgi:glycosyltransferase involved in cell wall biosynthesis
MHPKVTFVVPCYKLAHLLSGCVESMLVQTFSDFEVLIMDDCSPDHTPDVAQSFRDSRIKHIRNESNLGHLKNYNKGIALARGEYVWLISADDFLRRSYVLERYVDVMERNPEAGYVFCPAMKIENGDETDLVQWSEHGDKDLVFRERSFLRKLALNNCVAAPTGMVRKLCYDRLGAFPLNLPNSGDWYLWCLFALYYDVAYLAEPMVFYRVHTDNMSLQFKRTNPRIILEDNFAVRWAIMRGLEENGLMREAAFWKDAIATYYANLVACNLYESTIYHLSWDECEGSVLRHARDGQERTEILGRVSVALADQCYRRSDFSRAREFYWQGLRRREWSIRTWMKYLLFYLGPVGMQCRAVAARHRCRTA